MSRWYFVPEDWEMSESLRKWSRDKGLTESVIDEELDKFRDHQYKRPMMRPDACWRNWVRNGIKWGDITPVVANREYRGIQELSAEQKKEDLAKWEADLKRLRVVK